MIQPSVYYVLIGITLEVYAIYCCILYFGYYGADGVKNMFVHYIVAQVLAFVFIFIVIMMEFL